MPTVASSSNNNSSSSNNNNKTKKMTDEKNPKPLTVDIRVFMLITVSAMAIAFGVGVAMGPTAAELAMASAASSAAASAGGGSKLPKVHSVDVRSVEEAKALKGDAAELLHEPAGQHLLVDIKGIEAAFLDSEERLAHAMVETVKGAGLTMLSYHCHKLIPMGVSCVGVLLESHISFHTWPTEGVITLDLFTCGPNPLIPVVPSIKALFGVPRENDEIVTQWSHELRGFRSKNKIPNKDNHNYALLDHDSDLSQMIWSPMDCVYKEQVYSGLTEYQRVDVWDVVSLEDQPSQNDVLKAKLEPTDARWTTTELVQPTRYLFLDGVLQSDNTTHKEYHEALVHPAMFAHSSPKNVAIVGGAEGATLREVLKHKTVESVTMVEIDQQLMDLAKEYLPQMSDCSNLEGRSDNCFDDELLNLQIQDAKDWFLNSQNENKNNNLDVVIIDAIEPEMSAAISKDLYDKPKLWKSILDSLTEEGILAIQIGYAPTISDPKPDVGYNAPREILFQTLESLPQVEAMFVYEDSHVGFLVPKSFLIVCKSNSCRQRFYAAPEDLNMEIAKRIVASKDNTGSLQSYDGVTQIYYQVAPKAWETIYCRREPTPFECDYRHLDFVKGIYEFKVDAPADEQVFEIVADDQGTRVYSKVNIPKGSYIMAEHAANSLQLSSKAVDNLSASTDVEFAKFVQDHGHDSASKGSARRLVEIGASYFLRIADSKAESNVGRWIPPHPQGRRPKYSPVYERHRLSFDVFMVATKDIAMGDELVKYKHMWSEE